MSELNAYIELADNDIKKALTIAVNDVMRLRGVIKRAHGVIADAHDLTVPASVFDDIAPAIAVLIEQRNDAREGLSMS